MLDLEIVQGSRADWILQSPNRNRSTSTGFQSTDTLSCQVWSGLDGSTVLTPSVAWSDVATAKVAVTILPVDSAQLEQLAEYRLQVWVTRGSDTGCIIDVSLKVLPSPGSATQSIVPYCSLRDVLDIAPWVTKVQDLDSQQAGFYRQRLAAREWLDAIILSNDRGGTAGQFGVHSVAAFAFGSGGGGRRSLGPNPALIRYLASNYLITRPAVKRVCAYHAASRVGLAQIGVAHAHASLGAYCRDMADREVVSLTAEIDTNADGVGEILIPLTSTNTRFT